MIHLRLVIRVKREREMFVGFVRKFQGEKYLKTQTKNIDLCLKMFLKVIEKCFNMTFRKYPSWQTIPDEFHQFSIKALLFHTSESIFACSFFKFVGAVYKLCLKKFMVGLKTSWATLIYGYPSHIRNLCSLTRGPYKNEFNPPPHKIFDYFCLLKNKI